MPMKRTCKQAAALMVAREDRALGFSDRLALHVHLLICKACARFEQQLLGMRNQLKHWRNYTAED